MHLLMDLFKNNGGHTKESLGSGLYNVYQTSTPANS